MLAAGCAQAGMVTVTAKSVVSGMGCSTEGLALEANCCRLQDIEPMAPSV